MNPLLILGSIVVGLISGFILGGVTYQISWFDALLVPMITVGIGWSIVWVGDQLNIDDDQPIKYASIIAAGISLYVGWSVWASLTYGLYHENSQWCLWPSEIFNEANLHVQQYFATANDTSVLDHAMSRPRAVNRYNYETELAVDGGLTLISIAPWLYWTIEACIIAYFPVYAARRRFHGQTFFDNDAPGL